MVLILILLLILEILVVLHCFGGICISLNTVSKVIIVIMILTVILLAAINVCNLIGLYGF